MPLVDRKTSNRSRATYSRRCSPEGVSALNTWRGSTAAFSTMTRRLRWTLTILRLTLTAAKLDWAEIDPSILGTLFERGLDPDKRSQMGAHYTDREKIMMIVDPVIVRPWLAEWESAKAKILGSIEKSHSGKSAGSRTKAHDQAVSDYRSFLNELRLFRVLDPACGSGNFLYLALLALKDIEHRVSIEAEAMGLQREFSQIGTGVRQRA